MSLITNGLGCENFIVGGYGGSEIEISFLIQKRKNKFINSKKKKEIVFKVLFAEEKNVARYELYENNIKILVKFISKIENDDVSEIISQLKENFEGKRVKVKIKRS